MDFVTLSSIMTVVAFATFVAIVLWSWSGGASSAFEEAAQLPFEEEDSPQSRDFHR